MTVEIDADVRKAVEFLQSSFPAARLVGIAKGVGAVGPLLWGHYRAEDVVPVRLVPEPPTSAPQPGDGQPTQSTASE